MLYSILCAPFIILGIAMGVNLAQQLIMQPCCSGVLSAAWLYSPGNKADETGMCLQKGFPSLPAMSALERHSPRCFATSMTGLELEQGMKMPLMFH